jgi:hypothetical protein
MVEEWYRLKLHFYTLQPAHQKQFEAPGRKNRHNFLNWQPGKRLIVTPKQRVFTHCQGMFIL